MRTLTALALLVAACSTACVPIVAGAAAGSAAAKRNIERQQFGLGQKAAGMTIENGLRVSALEPGGPAELAGVLVGDYVTEVNGWGVPDYQAADRWIAEKKIGREFTVTLLRGDREVEVRMVRRAVEGEPQAEELLPPPKPPARGFTTEGP